MLIERDWQRGTDCLVQKGTERTGLEPKGRGGSVSLLLGRGRALEILPCLAVRILRAQLRVNLLGMAEKFGQGREACVTYRAGAEEGRLLAPMLIEISNKEVRLLLIVCHRIVSTMW